jgi:hypothetical protein
MAVVMTETYCRDQDPAGISAEEKIASAATQQIIPGLPETRRLEDFSDAAFSIIITLLVLEIHRPNAALGKWGRTPEGPVFLFGLGSGVHLCRSYLAKPPLYVRPSLQGRLKLSTGSILASSAPRL